MPSLAPLVRRGLTLALAAVLSGCAAMSEEECRTANWNEQGVRDAMAGHSRARLEDLREACSKAKVTPNAGHYLDGWSYGIRQFCTPDNGARWGREGNSYNGTCPPELEPQFIGRYRDGRRVWDAEQAVRRIQSDLDSRERELSSAKDEDKRQQLRRQLRDLDWRLRNARSDLDRAEWNFRQSSGHRPY